MSDTNTVEVTIDRLGAQGDGVARADTRLLFIPLTLPGERVKARIGRKVGDDYSGELVEIVTPSTHRVEPPCPHFSQCGGCSLQHLGAADYAAHKKQVVEQTLRQQRLPEIPVRDPIVLPAGTRRRVTLAAIYQKSGKVIIGFNARASHEIIDINTCPVTRPELTDWLPLLRVALIPWLKHARTLDLSLTSTSSGIDMLITGPEPDMAAREAMSALGALPKLARISWRANLRSAAEPMLMLHEPVVSFGGTPVLMPPGAFLQASLESEAVLTQLVTTSLKDQAGPVADLFCGLGTFTFPLAQQAEVMAYESDRGAINALRQAAQRHPRVTPELRDLFREPLTAEELNEFDAVVFDPPRAGASAQCAELAKSKVKTIIAISCNPGTFARDAATLIAGGYTCEWVQPVDQFLWSGHIELVAKFSR